MVVRKSKSLEVLFFIKYEESSKLAKELINLGVSVKKVYVPQIGLVDENTFHFDEVDRTANVVLCDSIEAARLASICPVNHAAFYFLDFGVKDSNDRLVREEDFYVIEVKDGKDKTRDDWAEAAVFFKGRLSEDISSMSNI